MEMIIGRTEEKEILKHVIKSREASLVAIYGRRRVGKTFLVHTYFNDLLAFEVTAIYGGNLKDQLKVFTAALSKVTGLPVKEPDSWISGFQVLQQYLQGLNKRKKQVVFIDEFPWFETRRSGFLGAFAHFWNTWASRQNHIVVVICGSAASWMIRNVVNNKGSLHQRITQKIKLEPFTLAETRVYFNSRGIKLDFYQILQLYMVFGGIPQYLKNVQPGHSATQTIQRNCFDKNGFLTGEFDNLYGSLFEKSDQHIKVVRALAKTPKGLSRQEIIDVCELTSGGWTTEILEELEESGFIRSIVPYEHAAKDAIYRLIDEYSIFYLKFMDGTRSNGKNKWLQMSTGNAYKIWNGMAFEAVCLKHVLQIKSALGIGAIQSEESSWRSAGSKNNQGAQIDLLIDRADRCINLCEMKFYSGEFVIDKRYAGELEQKMSVFAEVTKTKKTILLTMVTTYGVKQNSYAQALVQNSITMEDLFRI